MATIKDYLRQQGDITFRKGAFNVVDNLILATIAYVDLGGIMDDASSRTIADVLGSVVGRNVDVTPSLCASMAVDAELLRLIAESARFGGALLHDYVDEADDGSTLQFSAMTVDIMDGPVAVVFRGTDYSLVGWRENFLLGSRVTSAQRRAAAYLERALRWVASRGRRAVVCGHSKGGNLAAHAASVCPSALRALIDHVWNDDGPGTAPEVSPCDVATSLGGRFTRIVPERSVVGMLFLVEDGATEVVRSTAVGVRQHDLTTWEVELGANATLAGGTLSHESRLVAKAFADWLSGVDLAARERFTNELFDALAAGHPHRLDAALATPASLGRVLAATRGLSSSTRRVMRRLLGRVTAAVAGRGAQVLLGRSPA